MKRLFLLGLLALGGCLFSAPPGGTEGEGLTGILVDTRGVGVANVRMRLYPENAPSLGKGETHHDSAHRDSAMTNAKGRFDFPHVAKGRYKLAALLRRGDTTLALYVRGIVYDGGRRDIGNAALELTGGIRLHLQTGDASAPPPGTQCGVPESPFQGGVTDSGDCVVTGLPSGEFQIEISAPGYHPALSDALTVLPGTVSEAGSVDLTLSTQPYIPVGRHFPTLSSTIALWTFNAYATGAGNRFDDQGPGGFTLSGSVRSALEPSPKGSALIFNSGGEKFSTSADTAFVPASRRITLEARVRLSSYPNPSNTEASGLVVGLKDGIRLLIDADGALRLAGPQTGVATTDGAPGWVEDASAYSASNLVPLNQWVTLAVAVDLDPSGSQSYGYLNGVPVQLYRKGGPFAVAAKPASSIVTVGNDAVRNQSFNGQVDEVRLSNALVLGPGLPLIRLPEDSIVALPGVSHFGRTASTVALWTFDSKGGNLFADSSGNGHSLAAPAAATLSPSPHGNAVVFNGSILTTTDTALMLAGHDLLTYEARIWLDAYPPSSSFNHVAHVLGNYGGLELFIGDNGRIQVVAQKGPLPDWQWYGGETSPGTVPLEKWVNIAVAADKQNGVVYVYVDGSPVQFYDVAVTPGTILRSYAETPFSIGANTQDGQYFPGKIDEVRVSEGLVLGAGLPVFAHPLMVWSESLTPATTPAPLSPPYETAIQQPFNLEWSAVSGAGLYHVQIAADSTFASPLVNDSLVTSNNWTMTTLPVNQDYYWRVRARNGLGASAYTAPQFFTVLRGGGLGGGAQ
ncbi:MAG: hypothetical protein K0Q91_1080 [Fibrobacteria bacterium]|jgi:hypothetical protein|nr:hypothetical protein [Fibrobacteria bacterium]